MDASASTDPLGHQTMRVETPEHVAIEYPLAGLGSRFAALCADGLVLCVLLLGVPLVVALLLAAFDASSFFGDGLLLGLFVVYAFAVSWGYFLLFEALSDGQTPGKRLLSIRVVMEGGYPVTPAASTIRNLLRFVDLQPFPCCLFGGFCMLLSKQGKRLGDMAAGTVVVRELPIEFPEIQEVSTTAAAPRLSEAAYRALEAYVDRAQELESGTRTRLARTLWSKLPEDVRREASPNFASGWTLDDAIGERLAALYAEESARRHSARLSLRAGSAAAATLLRQKRARWEDFRRSVGSIRRRGLRSQDGDAVAEFAARYREVSADLARARTYGASAGTLFALERLVGAAHNLFYRPASRSAAGVWRFLARDFPRLFRARWKPIAVAALLLYGPAVGVFVLLRAHPEYEVELAGAEIIGRAEQARAEGSDYRDTLGFWLGSEFLSSLLIANNVQVSFLVFAGGALACLGSIGVLTFNGLSLGAALAVFANRDVLHVIGLFVLPHGVIELTAICIAGGAGLWMGSGLLLPGRSPRGVAFAARAKEAVLLLGGVAFLLVVAGLIEGYVSPSRLPSAVKLAVAAAAASGLVLYLGAAGRSQRRSAVETPLLTPTRAA